MLHQDNGLLAWRGLPRLPLYEAKASQHQRKEACEDSSFYPERPIW
jgi:hypothetical protein